ncbi:glyoxalase [Bizionia sediminis]|uniref:Glyoxalase n=1 Tax=Bizionia sediminis TaxID=1737064 RepID=A0ABW5KSL4_9FLAO
MTRSEQLLASRPLIPSAQVHNNMSLEERFQNETLRPIIKLQNDLLVAVFLNYTKKHKKPFSTLATEKQIVFIENVFQKNMAFKNTLKGIIIGFFTIDEYHFYANNASALNKRILAIIKERLISNLQILQHETS